jgi:hypothetical protein
LQTISTHLQAVEGDTFMSNMDIGEVLLNFVLHESMQALCGGDLTQYFGEKDKANKLIWLWEKWTWVAMGLKSLP